MITAYKKYWQGYVDFSSRASRKDYWLAFLMNLIVSFVLGFVLGLLGLNGSFDIDPTTMKIAFNMGPGLIITLVWSLINLLPGLSIVFRRLHDTNRSGWWIFISLIPFVGGIIFLVLLCLGSVNEGNRYSK